MKTVYVCVCVCGVLCVWCVCVCVWLCVCVCVVCVCVCVCVVCVCCVCVCVCVCVYSGDILVEPLTFPTLTLDQFCKMILGKNYVCKLYLSKVHILENCAVNSHIVFSESFWNILSSPQIVTTKTQKIWI